MNSFCYKTKDGFPHVIVRHFPRWLWTPKHVHVPQTLIQNFTPRISSCTYSTSVDMIWKWIKRKRNKNENHKQETERTYNIEKSYMKMMIKVKGRKHTTNHYVQNITTWKSFTAKPPSSSSLVKHHHNRCTEHSSLFCLQLDIVGRSHIKVTQPFPVPRQSPSANGACFLLGLTQAHCAFFAAANHWALGAILVVLQGPKVLVTE